MAKGVGLDAGGYEVKVVELDGSYKRPRLAKVSIDRVAETGEDANEEERAKREAEAALHALKDAHVARDNVCLGFPCREAVLRDLVVPFVGQDAIRKVIKFEAEGEIHSHSVDDMVVDFLTLEERAGETHVIVAAVPKRGLGELLRALESSGIEPEAVDLDTMALFRVAEWAGCFATPAAAADAPAAEGQALPATTTNAAERPGARIVVDVGARSTRVLAVVGGKIADMRALRVGVDSVAVELAAELGIGRQDARDAVRTVLESGTDHEIAVREPAKQDGESGDALVVASPIVVTRDAVESARDRLLMRLRREFMRFMAGLGQVGQVDSVHLTGGGGTMPGIDELLADVFRCSVAQLDVLGNLSHNLDDDEVAWINPRIAVAVGLALPMMGGPAGFNFRQEELVFRRRFDRIKFPLAIACMLCVFLPFIYGMRKYKQLTNLGVQYGALYEVVEEDGRRGGARKNAVFWGYVGYLLNRQQGGNLGQELGRGEFDSLVDQVVQQPTFARLPVIRSRLASHLREQQEATGVYEDLQLPSGFYVLSRFSAVVQALEAELGSFLVTDVELSLPSRAEMRNVTCQVAIRGAQYRERYQKFEEAFRKEFADPTSPFREFGKAKGETLFAGGEEPGAYYDVKLELKENYQEVAER